MLTYLGAGNVGCGSVTDDADGKRRSSDAPLRKFAEIYLPAILVLGGGLIAWGAYSARLDDVSRRVGEIEQSHIGERLGGIDATLSAVRGQLTDITEQLRGRR